MFKLCLMILVRTAQRKQLAVTFRKNQMKSKTWNRNYGFYLKRFRILNGWLNDELQDHIEILNILHVLIETLQKLPNSSNPSLLQWVNTKQLNIHVPTWINMNSKDSLLNRYLQFYLNQCQVFLFSSVEYPYKCYMFYLAISMFIHRIGFRLFIFRVS